jgi:non-ribosomal peptide synthetase component F
MIVGMVGIMMAGGVYTPMDPSMPLARVQLVAEETKAAALLTSHSAACNHLTASAFPNIHLAHTEDLWLKPSLTASVSASVCATVRPSDLAYCVTTSGSTGTPKSAPIVHSGFVHYVRAVSFMVGYEDICLQSSACTFDPHLYETVGALMGGATIVMLGPNGVLDMEYLARTIASKHITYVPLVPSVAVSLADFLSTSSSPSLARSLTQVKNFSLAGENFPSALYTRLHTLAPDAKIWNFYGPAVQCHCCGCAVAIIAIIAIVALCCLWMYDVLSGALRFVSLLCVMMDTYGYLCY